MPASNATLGPVVLTPREIGFFDQLRERLLHGMDATVGEGTSDSYFFAMRNG